MRPSSSQRPRLGHAGTAYAETRSAAEHTAQLQAEGFRVRTGESAGMPTAMMGEAGEGGPVIAILGEYDALPGLSQEAGVAEHRPCQATATAMAAAITCWAPPRCWRPRR
jgi:metal-dependent amidase/aminoacylase/carboxypeptidase family protein